MLSIPLIFLTSLVTSQINVPPYVPSKFVDLIRNGFPNGLVYFIPDSDVIDPSGIGASIYICPEGKKCNILCQSGCDNIIVLAGPTVDELLLICEGGACPGVKAFSKAELNSFICMDPFACAGASFQCGEKLNPNASRLLPPLKQ